MRKIAILGFGVVGKGTADLLTSNREEVCKAAGEDVEISYILDLRDFPDSPFANRVVHDFNIILNDKDVDTVVETMGGSHPAYDFSLAALKAGKNVVTSNKEVVANFGTELLKVAKENGVVYRFEASVGGGIPVITPLISCLGHNRITEIRGILNGTTNYILTKMFTFGDSFESALADAQAKGYAEKNPDADVLGTDACRKIVILASLVSGKMAKVSDVHTEGITKIRLADVKAAAAAGYSVKLLGRYLAGTGALTVAPFFIPEDSPLAGVSGVYNAIEVIGEPIGNVMFYGKGAGAGATASAVVADVTAVVREGVHYAMPEPSSADESFPAPFGTFRAKHYIAAKDGALAEKYLGALKEIASEGEFAAISEEVDEAAWEARVSAFSNAGGNLLSDIRVL